MVDWKPAMRAALMLAVPAGAALKRAFAGGGSRIVLDGCSGGVGCGPLSTHSTASVDHDWRRRPALGW